MTDYSQPAYWRQRYAAAAAPPTFDWHAEPSALVPALLPHLARFHPDECEILVAGCGTSAVAPALYARGYRGISCVDADEGAVRLAAARDAALDEMDFSVLDACDMGALPDACFDAVLDKALLDAVACGTDAPVRVPALVREAHRVLKPGGVWLLVTHARLEQRAAFLAAAPWASVSAHDAGAGAACSLLVARKALAPSTGGRGSSL